MLNLYNMEIYKKKLEEYKIEDEKNMYIFRVNKRYIISSSIFFVMLLFVAFYSLYKGLRGIERLTFFKLILIGVLIVYTLFSIWIIFKYKIIIKENMIISDKTQINMNKIKEATVKIDRISVKKFDKCLEIITEDKKRIKYRLNMENDLLFVKLVQKYTGDKLIVQK
ncbi:hypothetical protein EII29_09110 [Leptotrichia sp. OH3620_COT-345]|uniref:hypothetical protein n=1 Tax=Leptotrichia sp. OH3620_COT-345 TaxID=2491048 RepID=UPI000F648733|nr:hypothetical protein [Leptotrichia sp. OH3620_COT-345]RRD38945.1 hypothetical protein EII29_09110 [Leptotrichia sp. OH3620_COT-345]